MKKILVYLVLILSFGCKKETITQETITHNYLTETFDENTRWNFRRGKRYNCSI